MPRSEQWSPPPLARMVIALAALLATVEACRSAPSDGAAEPAPSAEEAGSPVAPQARRPLRHHYLGRTRTRCELYSIDGAAISDPAPVTCPADLRVGERIRLSGRSCIRESPSDPSRALPTICPGVLLIAEQADLATRDAGP